MNAYSASKQLLAQALGQIAEDVNIHPAFRAGLHPTAGLLADAGSRQVPWVYITTREGEEIERLDMGTTSIRAHANRAEVYSHLGQEFQYGDDDEIVGAITINEIAGIER